MSKNKKELIYKLLMILCLLIFVFSEYQLLLIYSEYRQMQKAHTQLSDNVVTIESNNTMEEETVNPLITVDFQTLKERNEDVVGWLYQKDTVINYPVVKCKDNSTYVRKDLDKKYSRAGTLFIDYRCDDEVILIYGHHMLDGSMLASILDYQKQSYYDEHPDMIYLIEGVQYRFELFLGFVTTTEDELYYLDSLDWLNRKSSDFNTDIEYRQGKLLILSTCYKQTGDERYILVGNLIEE